MLKQLAQSLYRNVMDEAGQPASLAQVIQNHPVLKHVEFSDAKTASSNDIPRWGDLGLSARGLDAKSGVLLGWADSLGSYHSIDLPVPALANLIFSKRIDAFSCDITDIETLAASKSNLSDYENLDEFAKQRCANFIGDLTKDSLLENLKHDQIRILGPAPTDSLSRFGWDGRINLLNSGGAHHFAAARYIAKATGVGVPITARLHEHSINPDALEDLSRQFDIFAIGDPGSDPQPHLALQDAFKSLRSTFFIGSMPWSPGSVNKEAKAVFLPKNDKKSQRVAQLFRKAEMLDVGEMLQEKLTLQIEMQKPSACRDHNRSSIYHR